MAAAAVAAMTVGGPIRVLPASASSTGTQLLSGNEQGFEGGIGRWNLAAGPVAATRDTTAAISGSYGIDWGAYDVQYVAIMSIGPITVSPGDSLAASIQARLVPGSSSKALQLAYVYYANGSRLSTGGHASVSKAVSLGSSSVTTLKLNSTVPSGANQVSLVVDAGSGAGSARVALDNASLTDTSSTTATTSTVPAAATTTSTAPSTTTTSSTVPPSTTTTSTVPATTSTTSTVPATTTTTSTSTVPAATTTTTTVAPSGPSPTALSIRVSGAQFVNQSGQVVHLRGVNRPGTEYGCVQNQGFISSDNGTSGQSLSYADSLVGVFESWNKAGAAGNAINAVRIPLNEDCWLGINGVPAAYSGANYQAFIEREVSDLTAAGMYSILDLHWSAPGSFLATQQDVEPNTDHSVTFWQQVASTFSNNQAVMFDMFNEPRAACYTTACSSNYSTAVAASWGCYLNGCSYTYSSNDGIAARDGYTFQIAGTQQLVNAIRATGAGNVIVVEGTGWGNDLWNWMAYRPTDPDNNMAAELHTYESSGQNAKNTSSLNSMIATGGLNTSYPIYLGEFGEVACSTTSDGFAQETINWAESQGVSWTAWGWDQGETCNGPSLVTSDSQGTPSTYGGIVKTNLDNFES